MECKSCAKFALAVVAVYISFLQAEAAGESRCKCPTTAYTCTVGDLIPTFQHFTCDKNIVNGVLNATLEIARVDDGETSSLRTIEMPEITSITGKLQLTDQNILSISMRSLKSIGEELFVMMSGLDTLYLDALTSIGKPMTIIANPGLRVASFEALTSVGIANEADRFTQEYEYKQIDIQRNSALIMVGLKSLKSVGSFHFVKNPVCGEYCLDGFRPTSVSIKDLVLGDGGQIKIHDNDILPNVFLPDLLYVGRSVSISRNAKLKSISLLDFASMASGIIEVEGNTELKELEFEALSNTSKFLTVKVIDNPQLVKVNFPKGPEKMGALKIQRNSKLTDVSLPKLKEVQYSTEFSIYFEKNYGLKNFTVPSLTKVGGTVSIDDSHQQLTITVPCKTPKWVSTTSFYGVYNDCSNEEKLLAPSVSSASTTLTRSATLIGLIVTALFSA